MKLFYIANARMPTEKAYGIQVAKMCEAFARKGVDVILIAPFKFNKIKKDVFGYYSVERNFRMRRLFVLDLVPTGIPYFGFWVQGITFALSLFFYLVWAKADTIYSRDVFSLFALSLSGKRFVYEMHNMPKRFSMYKWALKRAFRLVTITNCLKEELVRRGIAREKILVAPDGVDLEKFEINLSKKECRQKLNLSLNKKMVLYTGHLYAWKGAQVLAGAAKFLDKQTQVIFVGGTEYDKKEFGKRNRDTKNIVLTGHRPHAEIPFWLGAADVLVLPNSGKQDISRLYTSPLKLFEYMTAGKPIVASDLPSLREILNEDNSVLAAPDNVQALARSIRFILSNPALSDRIARNASKDVQRYSWSERAESIKNCAFAVIKYESK